MRFNFSTCFKGNFFVSEVKKKIKKGKNGGKRNGFCGGGVGVGGTYDL